MSQDTLNTTNDQKNMFAQRLKSAREAMHLDTKDVAAQLRLNERIILMLESGSYDEELPITFLKGYLRAYGKLLQLPENEIQAAIEPLQPKKSSIDPALLPPREGEMTSKNYTMQFASAVIGLGMIGLIGTWWHSHSTQQNHALSPVPMNLPQPVATAEPLPTATTPNIPLPTANPNPDSAAHPLANAMAQQISGPTPPAIPGVTDNKPVSAEPSKPEAAPAHKAAPVKARDDSDDDDDDNVDDNSDTD